MDGEGRYIVQAGGRGKYSRVRVRYLDDSAQPDEPRVGIDSDAPDAKWWPAAWLDAALYAATLALEESCAPGRCIIVQINDRDVPGSAVTPATIGIATVRAVWAALEYTPDATTITLLEAQAARGPQTSP